MKKLDVALISIAFFCLGLISGILFSNPEKQVKLEESGSFEFIKRSGICVFLDNEAKQYEARYIWSLDCSSNESEYTLIDSIIQHTIKKYFIRHSYVDFYKNSCENTIKLMSIIEKRMFIEYPTGFTLNMLSITEPEHHKTK